MFYSYLTVISIFLFLLLLLSFSICDESVIESVYDTVYEIQYEIESEDSEECVRRVRGVCEESARRVRGECEKSVRRVIEAMRADSVRARESVGERRECGREERVWERKTVKERVCEKGRESV
ncbi:Hypothetical predicted protein [Mytilus galloprovincialis]|uniref:Uncharacterized protein n=1 Tax=Mytilus galloprovincialis TaxID=29158 RepID=A0A8B6HAH0_MYTGA|nr:Hypothetical predicted protein [Mytilus galloprovincialis]